MDESGVADTLVAPIGSSAASSSNDPPQPPPTPHHGLVVPPDRAPPRPDLPCWARVEIPGVGSISWSRSNGDFVASCCVPNHGGISKCKKTRTSWAPTERMKRTRRAQGRPLGHLMAWLQDQHNAAYVTQKQHHAFAPSFEARARARAALKLRAGSADLFAAERPKEDDEGSEPEGLA